MKFSLIVATLGRRSELIEMLSSVSCSDYDKSDIEIIIVDQNPIGFLGDINGCFTDLNIIHILSEKKGLSFNRNLGLGFASGDVICFPDDDCKFYSNTLHEVKACIESGLNFCIGRIYDRSLNKSIIRAWPSRVLSINRFNFYFLNSSITVFVRNDYVVPFDESMGVGAKYGSCEDADFLYRILLKGSKGMYCPRIEVWHPDVNFNDIPLSKVKSYASGFGYLVRKHMGASLVLIFSLLIIKKVLQMLSFKFGISYIKAYFSGLFGSFLGK